MQEQEFRDLLDKCLDGSATPDEERQLVEAARLSPALQDELLRTAAFEASLRSLGHDAESFTRRAIESLSHGGSHETFAREARRRLERERGTRRSSPPWIWMVAAAALLLFAGAVLLRKSDRRETPGPKEAFTPPGPELPIVLPTPPKIEKPEPKKDPLPPVPPAPVPPPVAPRAPTREPTPAPPPKPPEPVRPAPEPTPAAPTVPAPPTRTAVAKVERVEGEAFLVTDKDRVPIQAGQDIVSGQGVETSELGGRVILTFSDKTRIEVGRDTRLQEIQEGPSKRFSLIKGDLYAVVTRQPTGHPLTILTSHSESTVLGTTLRIVVQPGSTRLEVVEGKVRLTRLADKKSIDVVTGHYAVTATGGALVSRQLPAMTQGLVAYWTFDEGAGADAQDESGFGHHGVLVQAPRRVPGKSGQALQFDGTRQYVRVPHSGRLNPGTSTWSVAAWVRTSEPALCPIVFKDNSNVTHHYYLATGSQAVFDVGDGIASVTARGTRNVADGRWHHLAGVWTAGRTAQLYMDGVFEAETAATGKADAIRTTADLMVGYTTASMGSSYFRGSVDEVRIYDRALSADEVKTLFSLSR